MNPELFTQRCVRLLERCRAETPLIQHITNYVTVNDCANITLAVGASPIMADAREEAAEIAGISRGLVLNMGNLDSSVIESMFLAGKAANRKGIPVVYDPVGAGASALRNATATRILDELQLAVLRGNISEIRFLAGQKSSTKGVDAAESDLDASGEDTVRLASELAARQGCVVAVTGAVDVISDGSHTVRIHNGHPSLSRITGTGCMCTALVGSLCGAAEGDGLAAAVTGVAIMGIAGEIAWKLAGHLGTGSLRTSVIDTVSRMDSGLFRENIRLDVGVAARSSAL